MLGEAGEPLRDAVFKDGKVGGLETVGGATIGVRDDDIEDDEA